MTSLSRAAQAVMDATDYPEDLATRIRVAAALRAAVEQVLPQEQCPPRRGMRPGGTGALSPDEGAEDQRAATRRKLLTIATELEGQ
jgi:hypothetical protein